MSRDAILAKIDRANEQYMETDIVAAADALVREPDNYRPMFDPKEVFDHFVAKATSETVTATVEKLDILNDLPTATKAYLQKNSLHPHIALQGRKDLTALDWSGIDTSETAQMNEPLAVTFADAGVAETGSLVFFSAPDAPVLMNFLPLHHLAVVRCSSILPHMEDVFEHFGTDARAQKRSCNYITGTSGTADIEARNVRGAHGPRFLHIFLLAD